MKTFIILVLYFYGFHTYAIELSETKALSLFVQKNLNVAAIKYEIEMTKAEEITASLWTNPTLFMDTQLNPFGENWSQENAGGPTQQDLTLTVPVDVNGRHRQAVKVAKLATKGAEAKFQAAMREGVFEMIDTFYRLHKLKREHHILIEKHNSLETIQSTIQKRNTNFHQSRFSLALASTKMAIQKNLLNQVVEENKLRIYLALESHEEVKISMDFKTKHDQKLSHADLVDHAKNNRPDFIALNLYKKQVSEQIDLDHREIWDDLSLIGGISRQEILFKRSSDPTSEKLPSAWSWMIGFSISLPVFDRSTGEILKGKLKEKQASIQERFMLESLNKDLDSSIKKIELTSQMLAQFEGHEVKHAGSTLELATRQFKGGKVSLVEYLDALNAHHLTMNNFIESQFQLTSELKKLRLISGQELDR